MAGKLTIIPTPIGNLNDITFRAIEEMKQADLLLAEDTRQTKKLLSHFELEVPISPYHQHNEHKVVNHIVDQILGGKNVALVSDAGTPGISDPGFLLIRSCVEKEIEVSCLPGATAFVPALVQSGIPCDRFVYEGFLPPKKGRQQRLKKLSNEKRTIVCYESPHRIQKTLKEFCEYFGEDRQASVSREISKIHEEVSRGTLAEILQFFNEKPSIKGEIVVVIAGIKK